MDYHRQPFEDDLLDFLRVHDAYWKWDDHRHLALLTSGKISDVFVNCTPVFTQPGMQRAAAEAIVMLAKYGTRPTPQPLGAWVTQTNVWVVGSAMGGIGLAQAVAEELGARAAYTESDGEKMTLKRFDLGPEPKVLLVEDVFTTGGTTRRTMHGIKYAHEDAEFYPQAFSLVTRQPDNGAVLVYDGEDEDGEPERHEIEMWGLAHVEARVWDSVEDLPVGMQQCEPVRPKQRWYDLTHKRLSPPTPK